MYTPSLSRLWDSHWGKETSILSTLCVHSSAHGWLTSNIPTGCRIELEVWERGGLRPGMSAQGFFLKTLTLRQLTRWQEQYCQLDMLLNPRVEIRPPLWEPQLEHKTHPFLILAPNDLKSVLGGCGVNSRYPNSLIIIMVTAVSKTIQFFRYLVIRKLLNSRKIDSSKIIG